MRGRKPKPSAIRILTGNPGKRPIVAGEPQPPIPDGTPYCPRHLNEPAKREWRRIVGILVDLGLYTEVDRAALAMYCQAWGRWVMAERKVQEEGEVIVSKMGGLYQNPWLHVANRAWEQMRKVLAEFGLTPSSRTRLSVRAGEPEPSLADVLFSSMTDE